MASASGGKKISTASTERKGGNSPGGSTVARMSLKGGGWTDGSYSASCDSSDDERIGFMTYTSQTTLGESIVKLSHQISNHFSNDNALDFLRQRTFERKDSKTSTEPSPHSSCQNARTKTSIGKAKFKEIQHKSGKLSSTEESGHSGNDGPGGINYGTTEDESGNRTASSAQKYLEKPRADFKGFRQRTKDNNSDSHSNSSAGTMSSTEAGTLMGGIADPFTNFVQSLQVTEMVGGGGNATSSADSDDEYGIGKSGRKKPKPPGSDATSMSETISSTNTSNADVFDIPEITGKGKKKKYGLIWGVIILIICPVILLGTCNANDRAFRNDFTNEVDGFFGFVNEITNNVSNQLFIVTEEKYEVHDQTNEVHIAGENGDSIGGVKPEDHPNGGAVQDPNDENEDGGNDAVDSNSWQHNVQKTKTGMIVTYISIAALSVACIVSYCMYSRGVCCESCYECTGTTKEKYAADREKDEAQKKAQGKNCCGC